MNFISLFTSFSGRINRAKWWIGIITLFVVGTICSILANPAAMAAMTNPEAAATNPDLLKPTVLQLVIGLVFSVLMLAVIFKRLNDRNWPSWVGIIIAIIYIGAQIAQYVLLQNITSIEEMSAATTPISVLYFAVFVFLLIDNGMLKGTSGPNQYGEDPLAHKNTEIA